MCVINSNGILQLEFQFHMNCILWKKGLSMEKGGKEMEKKWNRIECCQMYAKDKDKRRELFVESWGIYERNPAALK